MERFPRHVGCRFRQRLEIGEAVATEVKPEMSTVQVTVSLDAINSGDYVALRREPEKK